jgi:hypothetical protein
LLADFRAIFEAENTDRLPSSTVVSALVEIEESPWAEWHGKPITKNGVARILKRYEIRPATIRVGDTTPKGYRIQQFRDAWERYLPPAGTATPQQTASPNGHSQAEVAVVAVPEGGAA